MKPSTEQSIFAWRAPDSATTTATATRPWRGLLATSPSEFEHCGDVVLTQRTSSNRDHISSAKSWSEHSSKYTSVDIQATLGLCASQFPNCDYALLDCVSMEGLCPVAILLERLSPGGNEYVRVQSHRLLGKPDFIPPSLTYREGRAVRGATDLSKTVSLSVINNATICDFGGPKKYDFSILMREDT